MCFLVHTSDSTRVDLTIPGEQYFYLKAINAAERQKWLVALGTAKACLTDNRTKKEKGTWIPKWTKTDLCFPLCCSQCSYILWASRRICIITCYFSVYHCQITSCKTWQYNHLSQTIDDTVLQCMTAVPRVDLISWSLKHCKIISLFVLRQSSRRTQKH